MDFLKGLDDIGEPLKKYNRGEHKGRYRVFTVATPHQGETFFGSLTRARSDHTGNVKHKVPSHIGEYAWDLDGSMCYNVNAHAGYRDDELD